MIEGRVEIKEMIEGREEVHRKFKAFCNNKVCKYCKYVYKHTKGYPEADGQCEAAWIRDKYLFIGKDKVKALDDKDDEIKMYREQIEYYRNELDKKEQKHE